MSVSFLGTNTVLAVVVDQSQRNLSFWGVICGTFRALLSKQGNLSQVFSSVIDVSLLQILSLVFSLGPISIFLCYSLLFISYS